MAHALINPTAFWIDQDYDLTYAGDGRSRYRSYLYGRKDFFVDEDGLITDPRVFAVTAFNIARSPIMSPGYVREHPRVRCALSCWDDEERMAFEVQLVAPLPASIAAVTDHHWADWHQPWGSQTWLEPYDNDRPGAFTVVTVRVPITATTLPQPHYDHTGTPLLATAHDAVRGLCGQLNTALGPVLAALH